MNLLGKLIPTKIKNKKVWRAEIESIGIYTQGKSREDAIFHARDAIESLINVKDFKVLSEYLGNNSFSITSTSPLFTKLVQSRSNGKYQAN
jgi:predicted RNase H-like HicB family nuclease